MRQAASLVCRNPMIRQTLLLFMALACTLAAVPGAARDLSLVDAERLLAERNRELAAARRAVEAAGAQRISAAARPNATLSLNATSLSNKYNNGPGTANEWRADTVLRIDQPFERGGK